LYSRFRTSPFRRNALPRPIKIERVPLEKLILSGMADHYLSQIDDHINQRQHNTQFRPIHPIGIVIQIIEAKC
jgi:hypothetical protein